MAVGAISRDHLDAETEWALYGSLRHFWHPVMYAADLDDGPHGVVLLGQRLVVVRLSGNVCVFPDFCVHRGTALSLGWVENGDALRCAYHGWTYGQDGVCTSIPARFGSSIPRRARLRRHRAAEACGLIWVCLEDDPMFPLPEFPEFGDPRYRIVTIPQYDWRCNAARRVENYVDFAHFAWVHDGVLGDRNHPEVPDHDAWRERGELRFYHPHLAEPWSSEKNQGLEVSDEAVHTEINYRLFMPFTVLLQQRQTGDTHFVLFMSACPIGAKETRVFTFNARDYALDRDDQEFIDFQRVVTDADKPITESQRPEELPVDLTAELHIRGADRISLEYRRWLIEIARSYPN